MQGLHTLRPARGATKRSRRIGRGHGTGRGTYSGRGVKGQKARSGGKSGLLARSMKPYLMRIPKARGFSSGAKKFDIVNLVALNVFENGANVTLSMLRKRGLIGGARPVKILGDGELSKKISISVHAVSASARAALEKAGGLITIIPRPVKKEDKPKR